MDKFVTILWIFCAVSIAKCQDTFDCGQAPPSNVDPSSCCRISKPFDQLNFPECFNNVDVTSTARNDILNRDDRNARDNDDNIYRTRINGNANSDGNNRQIGRVPVDDDDAGDGDDDRRDSRPSGRPRWRFGGGRGHGGGWWHHGGGHGDYHSFGAGGRYRHKRQLDQVVVRTSVRAQVTLGAGVGNGNCAMQCIFNQTRIIANNAFNRDAALILYAKYFPEVPFDLLATSVNTCIDVVRNLPSNRTNRTRNTSNRCWNAPGVFAACFTKEIYTQCPDDIKDTSADCDALRDFIDNCSPSN